MDRWQKGIGKEGVGNNGKGKGILFGEKSEMGLSDHLCNQGVTEAVWQ